MCPREKSEDVAGDKEDNGRKCDLKREDIVPGGQKHICCQVPMQYRQSSDNCWQACQASELKKA